MPQYRHFAVEPKGNVAVIQLLDAKLADALVVTELQDELLDFIEGENPTNVLVSFNGVNQCSTAVINGLLRAKKRLMADGGQLKLCGMNDMIREAYRMLNLDGTVFKIYGTEDDALDEF
jgi:anti-anti-sigma factor